MKQPVAGGRPSGDAGYTSFIPAPELAGHPAGCYVYCVGRGEDGGLLGPTGIGGKEVYAVREAGLCALVHDCLCQPYSSRDPEEVAGWVLAHHRVVELAWRRWGAVLPITFNTIIAAGHASAHDNLRSWLEEERQRLEQRLDAVHGLSEYGVQLFCDPDVVAGEVATASPEIRALQETAASGPRGAAYLSRRRLERALQRASQARVSQEMEAFYRRIKSCVARVRVAPVKDVPGERPMVMNLSCLVSREQRAGLEAELDGINPDKGFSARLAGPLPPYSFC